MSQGMMCDKCGHDNAINNLFCQKCGAKLDYSSFKPSAQVAAQRKGSSLDWPIGNLIKILVFFLLVGVLGLLLWKVDPTGTAGEAAMAKQCNRKLVAMDHAVKEKRSESGIFIEEEVNAFLSELVKETFESGEESEGHLTITTINFRLTAKYVTALIMAEVGPVKLSYEITLEPKIGSTLAESDIKQARFGHLKLPGQMKYWMAERIMRVFKERQRELNVINNTVVEGLMAGKIKLRVAAN